MAQKGKAKQGPPGNYKGVKSSGFSPGGLFIRFKLQALRMTADDSTFVSLSRSIVVPSPCSAFSTSAKRR
jgi:hypothetical protein